MSAPSRSPYKGDERKLVIALDIGTTYSGVSYCFLDPGIVPEIKAVQRYPGQGETGSHCKIPTIVAYGPNGDVRAVGAEVEEEAFKEKIEMENLVVAKWFKLHLRPRDSSSSQSFEDIPSLPLCKSAVRVLADFMRYLFQCTKTYIIESYTVESDTTKGLNAWNTKKDVVLAHPNGWEGAQQDLMRRAAIIAGIIPDTEEGHASVHFVTEGEASLHYCISKGIVPGAIENNTVLVVDAGGGTIDVSGYRKEPGNKMRFEEVVPPQCHFHGAVFVTRNARQYLTDLLEGSKYHAAIDLLVDCFDKSTKLTFRNADESSYIRFGSVFDKDPEFGINRGKLKLDGYQVTRFFQPSVDCIIKAIHDAKYQKRVKFVLLVGGFAESDWLFNSLQDHFSGQGITICRPEQAPGKAVSDGAASFYIDHFVGARISRYTYGTDCAIPFFLLDDEDEQHYSSMTLSPRGIPMVPGHFSIILPKNTRVAETSEFEEHFSTSRLSNENVQIKCEILRYSGPLSKPKWVTDGNPSDWRVMCTVEADFPTLNNIAHNKTSALLGKSYYEIDFKILLMFGCTEFKAQIAWVDNGEEKRSPARVIYTENNRY
ncbi:hypothetical protein AX16_004888 [Volvariella volvacea WC 439]|nr:hypothetical protein AX16_004888 [Volvariella volvacea WC 439]